MAVLLLVVVAGAAGAGVVGLFVGAVRCARKAPVPEPAVLEGTRPLVRND